MEDAFGPYHRSSHGVEPMPDTDYSIGWYEWMVVIAVVTVALVWSTR